MSVVIFVFGLIGAYFAIYDWLFQVPYEYGPFPPEALFIKYRDGTHEYLSDARYWIVSPEAGE